MRTVDQIIAALSRPGHEPLRAPEYRPFEVGAPTHRIGLAVESMRRHTTDEGWQLFEGLGSAGYTICGHGLSSTEGLRTCSMTNVPSILDALDPSVVVIQDKREWEGKTAGGPKTFNCQERFSSVGELARRPDVFKVTVLKDAHNDRAMHVEAAEEMGVHAWIHYYHPRIVAHLAPFVRPQHLIRTWHSVDASLVPPFTPKDRSGCLISGAMGGAYPLRTRLARAAREGSLDAWVLPHPGYHRRGCSTPDYLKTLSAFKVAVCTSSCYSYALRKLMEATACGCAVITDLAVDDILPEIDENLVRISPTATLDEVRELVVSMCVGYDPSRQEHYANKAKRRYDFRAEGTRLAACIEDMRRVYQEK